MSVLMLLCLVIQWIPETTGLPLLPGTLEAMVGDTTEDTLKVWTYYIDKLLVDHLERQSEQSLLDSTVALVKKVSDKHRLCSAKDSHREFSRKETTMTLICGNIGLESKWSFLKSNIRINVMRHFMINVTMLRFSMSVSRDCAYNRMEFHDIRLTTKGNIKVHCGSKPPWSEYSKGNNIVLVFDFSHLKENAKVSLRYQIHDKLYVADQHTVHTMILAKPNERKVIGTLETELSCIYRRRTLYIYDLKAVGLVYPIVSLSCRGQGGTVSIFDGLSELVPLLFKDTQTGYSNRTLLSGMKATRHVRIIIMSRPTINVQYEIDIHVRRLNSENLYDEVVQMSSNTSSLRSIIVPPNAKYIMVSHFKYQGYETNPCYLAELSISTKYGSFEICQRNVPTLFKRSRFFHLLRINRMDVILYSPKAHAFLEFVFYSANFQFPYHSSLCHELPGPFFPDRGSMGTESLQGQTLIANSFCNCTFEFEMLVGHTFTIRLVSPILLNYSKNIQRNCIDQMILSSKDGGFIRRLGNRDEGVSFQTYLMNFQLNYMPNNCSFAEKAMLFIVVFPYTTVSKESQFKEPYRLTYHSSSELEAKVFLAAFLQVQNIVLPAIGLLKWTIFHVELYTGTLLLSLTSQGRECMSYHQVDIFVFENSAHMNSTTSAWYSYQSIPQSELYLLFHAVHMSISVQGDTSKTDWNCSLSLTINSNVRREQRTPSPVHQNISWEEGRQHCKSQNKTLITTAAMKDLWRFGGIMPVFIGMKMDKVRFIDIHI